MKTIIYRSPTSRLWHGRITAKNGRIVWVTSEGYSRKRGAQNALRILINHLTGN